MAGRLAKVDGLTEMQLRLVHEYVMCGDVARAGALAGYADNAGAYYALRLPHVQAAVKAETERVLMTKSFPTALRYLDAVIVDETIEHRLRAEAAGKILKLTLDFEKLRITQTGGNTGTKPLDQQSPEELRQHLDRLQQELANRANPVIDAPITRHTDTK